MNEFIEKTYPLFRQWIKDSKGFATVDGVEQIKFWYEFLGLLKEHLGDK